MIKEWSKYIPRFSHIGRDSWDVVLFFQPEIKQSFNIQIDILHSKVQIRIILSKITACHVQVANRVMSLDNRIEAIISKLSYLINYLIYQGSFRILPKMQIKAY